MFTSWFLNGDRRKEGNHDNQMNAAEPHVLPILYQVWIKISGIKKKRERKKKKKKKKKTSKQTNKKPLSKPAIFSRPGSFSGEAWH